MAKSRDDLINRALSDLGALPVGQTASTQEYASVAALVDPLVANLYERDIYYVSDTNAIEDAAFIPLGRCLAWAAAPEFGLHSDAALAALSEQAERHLKTIQSEGPTYQTMAVLAY